MSWENPRTWFSRTKFTLAHDCFTPHFFSTSEGASGKRLGLKLIPVPRPHSQGQNEVHKNTSRNSGNTCLSSRLYSYRWGFCFLKPVYVSVSLSICLQVAMCQNAHLEIRRWLLQVGPLWDPESVQIIRFVLQVLLPAEYLTCFRLNFLKKT